MNIAKLLPVVWGEGAPFDPSKVDGLFFMALSDLGAYQDTGATTPAVATNDPVKLLQDQSKLGNHVSSPTDGARPVITADVLNGNPKMAFTAAASSSLSKAFSLNQPFTLFCVANAKTDYGEVFGSAGANILRYNAPWGMYAGSYKPSTARGGATNVVCAVFDGANSFMRVNSVQVLAGNPGTGAMNSITIGKAGNAETMDGYAFLGYSGAKSIEDIQKIENWLYSKYGATRFMTIGDSKTAHNYWWQIPLITALETSKKRLFDEGVPVATAMWTTADAKANIDAGLAARTTTPEYIFINLGANDCGSDSVIPSEGNWKADTAYIIDACRDKYPNALIYMDHTWKRGNNTASATLKTWRETVIGLYASGVSVGLDETIWLENGDNGATYTTDGIHYSAAGIAKKGADTAGLVP